jgi:hypothetical protein
MAFFFRLMRGVQPGGCIGLCVFLAACAHPKSRTLALPSADDSSSQMAASLEIEQSTQSGSGAEFNPQISLLENSEKEAAELKKLRIKILESFYLDPFLQNPKPRVIIEGKRILLSGPVRGAAAADRVMRLTRRLAMQSNSGILIVDQLKREPQGFEVTGQAERRLARQLNLELLYHRGLQGSQVNARVELGKIILEGEAKTATQRGLAEQIVLAGRSGIFVQNRIGIR